MHAWTLDARLAADSVPVLALELSELRLMDDSRWPWLLLVPRVAAARELLDLERAQRLQLLDEIERCSRALLQLHAPDKLNVAALGNVVEQLHVHVIARYRDDAAWPRPVWGVGERVAHAPEAREAACARLRSALSG